MNDQDIQSVNDMMFGAGEQTDEQKEREVQWLIKTWTHLEEQIDTHDCHASDESGCEIEDIYYNFMNKYIYE